MRADARRNYERILAVAEEVVAEQGAEASLEEIARRAGVGSATLHRHFPSRQALLDAVFRERVEALCAQAEELVPWLRAVARHAAANRGLGPSLTNGADCHAMIIATGSELLEREDTVRPDVTIGDLLTLAGAISSVTEGDPDAAERLMTIALEGISRGVKSDGPNSA
ncbi:TetR/AcrR family transcriptional regulator [Lentzea tibetensis]|uniref:TetR/AcrR family transcriptional regulator n=1 Tax=Lentzea tibetensis TaxID=2591470 RepID=A0A563EGH6_9PSEU|nr:TetR/AcrR family transcriptional regulator [Lentzea tibetensis]TWP45443.1 TetR/AcrR family transcriptional regulator [Lentzea tibetensis]